MNAKHNLLYYMLLIIGHYGVVNWGDEAILRGLLEWIQTDPRFANIKPVVVSANPEFTKKEHKVMSVPHPPFGFRSFFSFRWTGFFSSLFSAKAVIIGGGGLFQPHPWRALWIWGYHLFLALLFQKPVFILGNSFETPQKSGIIIFLLRKLFAKVHYFSLRDGESKEIGIQFWGIDPQKISVQKDFAYHFALPAYPTKIKKTILLMMREGDLPHPQEKTILETLKKNFPQHEILAIVMQQHQSKDENIAMRYPNITLFFPVSLEHLFSKIAECDVVISSRLHGSILAKRFGKKVCIIAPRAKIVNLFGRKNCILPSEISEKTIMAFFDKKDQNMEQ